ncbi:PspC domain-containing protein [Allosphingosinicella flava]|uniref:PspC domain-containing protein n=1 Tax=Allosphingosinicella flava TaxID=2771430 RepID=A0A7T2GLT6_9SPHN|nr:PspC domain-containing protein [Sphingosinicella flava]QPQ56147.1 PspC domain-containing protein [Sphingosinicella flava]
MTIRRKFALDKANAKWLGVCSGIARTMGWDVTFVRIGIVAVTVLGAFPWTLIAYGLAGWLAPKARGDWKTDPRFDLERPLPRSSTYDVQASMRDIDHRLASVESYVTNANTSLAREIEELR